MDSPYLRLLKDRIDLRQIPFTERGSRLLIYRCDDHFLIRLAERWYKRTKQLSAYRQRPPIIDQFQFADEHGKPLKISLSSYPHCVVCHTEIGDFVMAFCDMETLILTLPPGKMTIEFQVNVDQSQVDRRGGVLHVTGDIRRNIAYTTNAKILSNVIESPEIERQQVRLILDSSGNEILSFNVTPRLGFNRYLPESCKGLEISAKRWHDWFASAPPVAEPYALQYYFAWWVMRAGLISTRFYTTREAMTPSKFYYLGVWQWDAYFHALAYRHVDINLAYDQLRILIDHQRDDGMLPDAIHDEGVVTHLDFPIEADVTKPPLVAWSAWKLYEKSGDREFLDEIYESLVRWNRWWFEKNDLNQNGLCEYQHPFSSGLDDSPLWDEGMPVESPDLNTYLCLQLEALSKIAREIGEMDDSLLWAKQADQIARRMVDNMWDARSGLFWASCNGRRVNVKTLFNLYPLLTGRMPPEVTSRLIAHLTNEAEFWCRYPVPTVALDDPKFDPDQMWRGPTWTNINYLLIEGLRRSGFSQLSNELRQRTLEMISNQPDIYEYYNPITGRNPPRAAPIFGWSSSVFIDLAIQYTLEKHPDLFLPEVKNK